MGKYALLLVAAFSMVGARMLFSNQETDVKSAQEQGEHDADLIAREVARSAYNAALGDANVHGSDIPAALAAVGTLVVSANQPRGNVCANQVATCYRRDGVMQGGKYRVEASVHGGNGIDMYARGQYAYTTVEDSLGAANYGRQVRKMKTYEINEARTTRVLQKNNVNRGLLKIQFIDSQAGYCSAIFLQRTLPGGTPGPLEMVYIPGHNRNGDRNVGLERILEPGVQMNFAIGVETGCTMQKRLFEPSNAQWNATRQRYENKTTGERMYFIKVNGKMVPDTQGIEQFMANYTYNAADWNWTHWALDSTSLFSADPQEAPWGMVETDPTNDQRWRIAFEDIDNWNLPSTHPKYNDPRASLWATKRFGYDTNGDGRGDGWFDNMRDDIVAKDINDPSKGYTVTPRTGPDGFHDLSNWGNPSDFSDQVIIVESIPYTESMAEAH